MQLGKSVADGIGGRLKTKIKDKVTFDKDLFLATPEAVVEKANENSSIQVTVCRLILLLSRSSDWTMNHNVVLCCCYQLATNLLSTFICFPCSATTRRTLPG